MNKILAVIFAALVGSGLYLISLSFNKNETHEISREEVFVEKIFDSGLFKLSQLPPTQIAKVNNLIVEESQLKIDPALKVYQGQEIQKLLLISALKQFVNDKTQKIIIDESKGSQSVKIYMNQYGIPLKYFDKIEFNDAKEKFLIKVDDKPIYEKDVEKTAYYWGAQETKIFRRKLEIIIEILKTKILTVKASENKQNTQKYIEGLLKKNNIDQEQLKSFVIKNLINKPIEVNLFYPSFNIELKPEWTPVLRGQKSNLKFLVFDSFYSQSGREYLSKVPELSKNYADIEFGFRPVFSEKDIFQNLLAEMSFCVWAESPEKYWSFIKEAVKIKSDNFEKDIYGLITQQEMNLKSLKQCFYEKKYKNVVDYHQDYAKFLGIHAGPVTFFDGEVYSGELSDDKLKTLLGGM